MDHMGFLKHLRKYKAEIGQLNQDKGKLKRELDAVKKERDKYKKALEDLDSFSVMRGELQIIIDEGLGKDKKPPYFDLDD